MKLLYFIEKNHPSLVTNLITGQTCVCLVNLTLALGWTMGAFVL